MVTRDRQVVLALVGAAVMAILGVAWLAAMEAGAERVQPEAVSVGLRPEGAPRDPPHEEARNGERHAAPVERRAFPDSSAGHTDGSPSALESGRVGLGSEELDGVLSSFYGPDPRIGDLRGLIGELGELASVRPDSVEREEGSGEVTGVVEIPTLDRSGRFRVQDGRFVVELPEWYEDEDYSQRSLTIQFTADGGSILSGQTSVQHQFDVRDPAVIQMFSEEERIVSWLVPTDRASGTRGVPLTASKNEEGALVFGHSRSGDVEPILQEWDWDLSGYRSWYELLRGYGEE